MTSDEIRRLVGGYATGTLTESERAILMQAALDDQELFEELAREQELKELLGVPGVRARLSQALAPPPPKPALFWTRPWVWTGAAAVAALALTLLLRSPEPPVEIAAVPPSPAAVSSDAPVPTPAELSRKKEPPAAPAKERGAFAPPADTERKDQVGEAKAKVAETESALRDEVRPSAAGGVAGGVIGGVPPEQDLKKEASAEARSQPAPVKAAPPTPAAVRQAKPQVLSSKSVMANIAGQVAFRYAVAGNTLTITPVQPGYVSVAASQQNAAGVTRRVTPGTVEQFDVPLGAPSVVVTFSAAPPSVAQQQQKAQQVMRERAGAVNLEPQQDFATVEIALP